MATTRAKPRADSFVWTDDEGELLLRCTLEYKKSKLKENVDWEACQFKYSDIADEFRAQYPKAPPVEKEFPHDVMSITKTQVATKLKTIRYKYRHAVDTGRRSGHGRVVLLYRALCEEIWGGSLAARSVDGGTETADLEESPSTPSSTHTEERPAGSPTNSSESPDVTSPAVPMQRRDLRQAKLTSHGEERLKRNAQADPAEEDLKIKRRILKLMEEEAKRNADTIVQINANIAKITDQVQEGFTLMREMLRSQSVQPHSSSQVRQVNEEQASMQTQRPTPPAQEPAQVKKEELISEEGGRIVVKHENEYISINYTE